MYTTIFTVDVEQVHDMSTWNFVLNGSDSSKANPVHVNPPTEHLEQLVPQAKAGGMTSYCDTATNTLISISISFDLE